MDRRTALQRIAILMGGTLSASTVAGVLGGCSSSGDDTIFTARTLSEGRDELVATLSELIIPQTDTPGARAAKVHEFIDNMLTDWYDEGEVEDFLSGLKDVQHHATRYDAESFTDLSEEIQIQILSEMELNEVPFFQTIKSMTLLGYYTSEVGATQELRINPMGVYKSDIPFSEVGRAWA